MKRFCKVCDIQLIRREKEKRIDFISRKYCSRSCANKVRVKKVTKGYFLDKDGYVVLSGTKIKQHRLVMEQHLGRKLNKNEVVHHINHVKSDNRIENLELIKNDLEHKRKYHSIHKNEKCHVEGCEEKYKARGYCFKHYNKFGRKLGREIKRKARKMGL